MLSACAQHGLADEPAKSEPLKALLITGGCCHDYTQQKQILSEGISARANVNWCVIQQGGSSLNTKIPLYNNPDWAKGFDVVVHDECFAEVKDLDWIERILKPHREGVPAVLLHCAMHCYRGKTDEWFKFCGVTSHRHGAQYPFDVVNLAKANPIMEGFGDHWVTPNEELYQVAKVWPNTVPLAQAKSRETKKDEVLVWTNTYGQGRVFGTTIGHHNGTISQKVYLDMVTRGLLWAAGKLDKEHLHPLNPADRIALPDPTPKAEMKKAEAKE
ncbi:MAG: ThuA domain-containing protein [Planctomycetia bacterium]|nr:ThuA domain-containing protein [Planctomycetia bacterium]